MERNVNVKLIVSVDEWDKYAEVHNITRDEAVESVKDGKWFIETCESIASELLKLKMAESFNTSLIFNDVDGNELKAGDKVVCLDVEDLEDKIISRGLVLEVNKPIDIESNFIEFKGINCLISFYGHRVLKLKI